MAYQITDSMNCGAVVFETADLQAAFAMRDHMNNRDDGRSNSFPRYLLGKAA